MAHILLIIGDLRMLNFCFVHCPGIVGLIMARILRKDFARYNQVLSDEDREEANKDLREETGWKLVYGDVFRPPPNATLLSVVSALVLWVAFKVVT